MQTQQTIAVVGDCRGAAGYIVTALARGNNKLLLCGGEQQEMEQQLTQIKAGSASVNSALETCCVEACWQADIILLQMPNHQLRTITERIRAVANRKLVLNVEQDVEQSSQALLQQLLPNCKCVQVVVAPSSEQQPSLMISSNNEVALHRATTLLVEVGLTVTVADLAAANHAIGSR